MKIKLNIAYKCEFIMNGMIYVISFLKSVKNIKDIMLRILFYFFTNLRNQEIYIYCNNSECMSEEYIYIYMYVLQDMSLLKCNKINLLITNVFI